MLQKKTFFQLFEYAFDPLGIGFTQCPAPENSHNQIPGAPSVGNSENYSIVVMESCFFGISFSQFSTQTLIKAIQQEQQP
jgi:hypothetical protein